MAPLNGTDQEVSSSIGSLNEKPLHAALKQWYSQPGDQIEVAVDGYVIDITRDDMLIEIQTRNFGALKRKLIDLTARHRVRLVYPIAREKWIVKLAKDRVSRVGRRKSPKRGTVYALFGELVSFPFLLAEPNFALEVLLIQEEELRYYDGKRAWRRRGWVTQERQLLQVVDQQRFEWPRDIANLIPAEIEEPFSTADLARAIRQPRRLAQRMAYCLRELKVISQVGKRGNAIIYRRVQP